MSGIGVTGTGSRRGGVPLPAADVRQLTLRAIVLGIILAVLMGAANTYLGLFAGMTIASAIPSAVVSMAVLKLLGGGGILENNIVQTGGSAGSSTATGVIFTTPALVMLGAWHDYHYGWVFAFAAFGGVLGVLFSVPLRRALIVEQQLPFPEGTAAAEVLRAGADPARGAKLLSLAAAAGAAVKLAAANGLRLIPDAAIAARHVGRGIAYLGTDLSPALLGVGYICGPNVGIVMLAGGVICWNIAIPIYGSYFLAANTALAAHVAGLSAADAAGEIWSQQLRFLGVGAMLIGGLWTLVSLRGSLLAGVRSGLAAARLAPGGTPHSQSAGTGTAAAHVPDTERDLPMKYVIGGVVAASLPLLLMYHAVVGSFLVSVPMTVIMIVLAFLFCSVSGYMAGLVGSSNDPVSGMVIASILAAAVMLLVLTHGNAVVGPVAAVMIGAAVCCALSISGDNVQDLKCGRLVGATPWRQQLMIGIGAITSATVLAPVLNLLARAYGIGTPSPLHPHPLLAPQATMMAAVSTGLFGGHLPMGVIGVGVAIGLVVIAVDEWLRRRGGGFRAPVLAVAVGIYLPFEISVPVFLGGMLALAAARHRSGVTAGRGMLFAAGMIAGESLTGVILAIPIVASGRADVLALPARLRLDERPAGALLGLALYAVLAWLLYRVARHSGASAGASAARPE
ncbi:MAG TPA: oligopeptide transporter, OPT family [Steroidobacteraceae bacterium]|nr:oligopeptide transporter, OPT family [Steroidobacteraceae bacterium]